MACAGLVALALILSAGLGHAAPVDEQISIDQDDILRDLRAVLRSLHPAAAEDGTGCDCVGYNCGCCLYIHLPEIGLDDTVCANISYLPADYGISVTLSVDDHIIFNETVSARNPPPICAAVPYLKDEVSLCLVFYDLDFSNTTFSGCLKIEVRLFSVIKEDYDLGCFHVGDLLSSPAAPGVSKEQHAAAITAMLKRVKTNLQIASKQHLLAAPMDRKQADPSVEKQILVV